MADAIVAPRVVTFGDLWALADAERAQAETLEAVYAADLSAATCEVDRAFYRRRLGELRWHIARMLAMQRLIERCEQSAVIKAELKRMADAAADAAAGDTEAVSA